MNAPGSIDPFWSVTAETHVTDVKRGTGGSNDEYPISAGCRRLLATLLRTRCRDGALANPHRWRSDRRYE